MVGEGVLLECLGHPTVERVMSVSRRSCGEKHPKLTECIIPDFLQLDAYLGQLNGYDACFYCAGVSSAGMNDADYPHVIYGTTLHFAQSLATLNPAMTFVYVSGSHTDSSERARLRMR